MKKNLLIFLLFFPLISPLHAEEKVSILIDHDGNIDDYLAVFLQLVAQPEKVKGVTVVPADSYLRPALWNTKQILEIFHPHPKTVSVGISDKDGLNPFPAMWREEAWSMARMAFWKNALPNIKEAPEGINLSSFPYAPKMIADILKSSDNRFDLLLTGPFTHLAEALRIDPSIKSKIRKVYAMGGAVRVKGNVEVTGHDGSAEWNIYNNPQAAKEVVESGISLTLVPLDATQFTPISKGLQQRIKERSHEMQYGFFASSLKEIQTVIDSGEYFFWDTLTSAAFIYPEIVKTQKMQIQVITEGPSTGKTTESIEGSWIDVAIWADQKNFEDKIISLLDGFKPKKIG